MSECVLDTTENGFLIDATAWDEYSAEVLASRVSLVLTPAHWEILFFIREYYFTYHHLPNNRLFVKAVCKQFGAEKGNSRYLHALFPNSPVKYACLIAGLPQPPHCI